MGKTALRSTTFQEEMVHQVMEILADHLSQHACSISFPEIAHIPLINLRAYMKVSQGSRTTGGKGPISPSSTSGHT